MIYTSYFANYRNFSSEDAVSVARWAPSNFTTGSTCPDLYPPADLLRDYKNGQVSEEEYIRRYKQDVLAKLNPVTMYKALDRKILLCFEKKGSFCHRNIIAEWFRFYGYECEEL